MNGSSRHRQSSAVAVTLASAAALAAMATSGSGCTIVVPPMDAGMMPMPVPDPRGNLTPPKVPAHALFIVNLHQSSANLAGYYAGLAQGIVDTLDGVGLRVTRWALAPTYPATSHPEIPALLVGGARELNPPDGGADGAGLIPRAGAGGTTGGAPILPLASALTITTPDGGVIDIDEPPGGIGRPPTPGLGSVDVTSALQQMAASGFFDGTATSSEAAGVVSLGARLADARLRPELGGLDGQDFFDSPPSLFIVVYLQPLARHCGLGDSGCLVGGRPASEIFAEADANGKATWLRYRTGGMPIKQIVHVAVTTKEGESIDAFRARCANVPGFPKNLFDVMEPSPASYYDPLITALNAAHPGTGQSADMCDLLSSQPEGPLIRLMTRVAVMAGPPGGEIPEGIPPVAP